MREWTGPALLSYGFRPFFLLGSLWAALAMGLWILMLTGGLAPPIAWDPVTWHAHAFLIGYLGAIVAGFVLTAVPNWTGRLPVVGGRLGLLAVLWVLGRIAVLVSAVLPWGLVMIADLAFLLVLAGMLGREIVAARNWRNLIVLALMLVLILGGVLFHWQAARDGTAAQGAGLRLILGVAIMMISVIGGRIVPSFTRNWLERQGSRTRPALPMQSFDKATLLTTLAALTVWIMRSESVPAAVLMIAAGGMQAVRLARWRGDRTGTEPLVWVLHLAYAFVPLGALAMGAAILWPGLLGDAPAQHLWMAGAIGLMTLAVMTRATLGHTGQDLHAGAGTTTLYLAIIGAVVARVGAGVWPGQAMTLYAVSGVLWSAAFLGFAGLYGRLLLHPKPAG